MLASGGHNLGIVSPPGTTLGSYQMADQPAGGHHVDPALFDANAPLVAGSWWPAWTDWLGRHAGAAIAPPALRPGAKLRPLEPAPGRYVREP